MRTIENAADIIIKNRWFICQCIFLAYISALAIMDFKFRKLPLKFLLYSWQQAVVQDFFSFSSAEYQEKHLDMGTVF